MKPFPQLPSEVVQVLGPAASSKLLDYLFEIHSIKQEETASMAEGRFEKRLTQEVSGLKSNFAELRADMLVMFAGVQKEFVRVHEKISDLHGSITSQTKWILTELALAVTLYPVTNRLMLRLLP